MYFLFLNNDENRINRLNNINNSFGIVPFIVLAEEPSISLCRESFKAGAFDFSFSFQGHRNIKFH